MDFSVRRKSRVIRFGATSSSDDGAGAGLSQYEVFAR